MHTGTTEKHSLTTQTVCCNTSSFPIHSPTCPIVRDIKKEQWQEKCCWMNSMNTEAPINSKDRQLMLASLLDETEEYHRDRISPA